MAARSPIKVRSQIEYTKLPSTRFLCAKCLRFMIEWTPVIKAAMQHGLQRMIKEDLGGRAPRVWLQCPNGCARYHGFYDVKDKGRVQRRISL